MSRRLELEDIQGNVVRAYGKYSYPVARYFFLQITDGAAGRRFVQAVRPKVTTAARWPTVDGVTQKPKVTLNVGFTFYGLWALGLPTRTLSGFPDEFIDGMKARAHLLGDRDQTLTEEEARGWDAKWDPIWRDNAPGTAREVHVWMSMNAQVLDGTDQPVEELEAQSQWLRDLCADLDQKVRIVAAHGRDGTGEYQEGRARFIRGHDGRLHPAPFEHFGFTDGLGDPIFEGQLPDADMRAAIAGRGKRMSAKEGWRPLATGEFLLGHPDESQELPPAPAPWAFSRNGAFMAYRKLHQNVASWRASMEEQGARFAKVMGVGLDEAELTVKSKIVGRWPDGVPLAKAGTFAEWSAMRARLGLDDPDPAKAAAATVAFLKSPDSSDFRYADDMKGLNAPNACHMRRVNTRDYLDPLNDPDGDNPEATTQLQKRRHILRRGLPYGGDGGDDDSEQGVIFMAVCASLFRQFEFIQQQWIQYGLDFNAGNNACPLIGDHKNHARFGFPVGQDRAFVCDGLRTFVETRGGDYFFLPSLTALKMIGMGIVDPT